MRSGLLERQLGTVPNMSGDVRIGVEHELQVRSQGRPQDFRALLTSVSTDGLRIDPADPRARRLPSGLAVTADGWEAELVTPPVVVGPDVLVGVDCLLEEGRAQLLARLRGLDPAIDLVGFSTHVNVTVPDDLVVVVAGEFARRCSVAAMLVLDASSSPGLLVRPRRGRLEVGGEYADGTDLVAAVTLIAASTALLVAACGKPGQRLPRVVEQEIVPARERYGHFVGGVASGRDLHREGRGTALVLASRSASAQEHLEEVWELARPFALGVGLDPEPVDALVSGRRPLRLETSEPSGTIGHPTPGSGRRTRIPAPDFQERQVSGVTVTPAWATWGGVAWRCEDAGGRVAYAVVPAQSQPRFLSLLDAGVLDQVIARGLRRSMRRRVLVASGQADRPGMWHDVHPSGLVPAERDRAGAVIRAGRGGASGRPDEAKNRADESSVPSPAGAPRFTPRVVGFIAAAALVLAAAATAVAMTRTSTNTTSLSSAGPSPTSASGSGAPTANQTPGTAGDEVAISNYTGTFSESSGPTRFAVECPSYCELKGLGFGGGTPMRFVSEGGGRFVSNASTFSGEACLGPGSKPVPYEVITRATMAFTSTTVTFAVTSSKSRYDCGGGNVSDAQTSTETFKATFTGGDPPPVSMPKG